jgi:hypothetical protein
MLEAPLKNLRISHARYDAAMAALRDAIKLAGAHGTCIPLLGPTRVGKTDLVEAICNELVTESAGPGYMLPTPDLIQGFIRPKPNDAEIYAAIIRAIGARVAPNTKLAVLQDRVQELVYQRGIKYIVLDECSHCAEPGANLTRRAAADHIKTVIDQSGAVVILTGLPKFQRLIDQNEQLSARSMASIYLLPYRWSDQEDRQEFVAVTYSIFDHLEDVGIELEFDPLDMTRRLYAATGGRVGLVVELIEAALKGRLTLEVLSRQDLQKGASTRLQTSSDMPAIFAPEVPQDTVLARSYAMVMRDAGLRLPNPNSANELHAFQQAENEVTAA